MFETNSKVLMRRKIFSLAEEFTRDKYEIHSMESSFHYLIHHGNNGSCIVLLIEQAKSLAHTHSHTFPQTVTLFEIVPNNCSTWCLSGLHWRFELNKKKRLNKQNFFFVDFAFLWWGSILKFNLISFFSCKIFPFRVWLCVGAPFSFISFTCLKNVSVCKVTWNSCRLVCVLTLLCSSVFFLASFNTFC